jgi:glycosyltransferase involved in cell wall biosynthesis
VFEEAQAESGIDRLAYRYLKRSSVVEDRWYASTIRDMGAGVVHAHFGTDGGYILPAARAANVPLVVSWYGYDISQFPRAYGGLGMAWLRPVLREARLHLAMTSQMATNLCELGVPQSRIRVHHFGIDCAYWGATATPVPAPSSPKRILMVASFVEKKGHSDLIRAFAEVAESDSECTLRLVGSGPLEAGVRALVHDLKLEARVCFVGFLPYGDELLAEYRGASIYVHPSRIARNGDQEGLPTAILEAMAAGLPVVSTLHAGIPDAVRTDSGLLVDEGDVHSLAQALLSLLDDPGLRDRMGERGRSRVFADFNLSTQERRLESFYDEARGVGETRGDVP